MYNLEVRELLTTTLLRDVSLGSDKLIPEVIKKTYPYGVVSYPPSGASPGD